MGIKLEPSDLEKVCIAAEKSYPQECCGVLVGYLSGDNKTVVEVREMENVWDALSQKEFRAIAPETKMGESKRGNYAIAAKDLVKVQKETRDRNLNIIGIYHSHPDCPPIPSEFDRQVAWQEYSYIIVSVTEGKAGEVKSWRLDDNHQFQPEKIFASGGGGEWGSGGVGEWGKSS